MAEPVAPALDTANRAYKIGGISVEFPYKAYGSQLAYMGKVVATLERSHRIMMQQQPQQPRSHCHALLESPTGTGKSLALLCATLAWQKHFQASLASQAAGVPASVPQASVTQASLPQAAVPLSSPPPGDVFVNGGGFVVEASAPELEQAQQRPGKGGKQTAKKPKVPTIFYATRTHSQITQVLREFRKTNYRVPMAVLASRKHYCTNKYVCKKKNVDEECKLLLKEEDRACPQFKNVHKVKNHSSLKKGGFHEVHDIEDLVSIGYSVKGCAYFAARSMASEAQIVFCPYSYILNPMIRKAMEINVQGAIIVLDEAHNIEDIAREAGSMDLEISVLEAMRVELEQLSALGPTMDFYQPLLEMVQEMLGWLHQQVNNLEKQDFEHYCSSWTGDRALQALQAAGISLQCFPILLECANKAIVVASDPEAETSHLSGVFASALEGLFSSLKFMLCNSGQRVGDYRLVVQKYVKRDEALGVAGWSVSISLWCLNPAVVFEELATKAQTVILTSGTLSPMGSFASELGVPFEIHMEAPHVIDMDKQVWASVVAMGPGMVPLNASYKNADGFAFQDSLGSALEGIFKVSPDGVLVFFPSYKLMENLCNRWKGTGQWTRFSTDKKIFIEPRGNHENFETILSDYYKAVQGLNPLEYRKRGRAAQRKGAKVQHLKPCSSSPSPRGAAFLAVCRGKVSEGIDFSDRNARVVIVVGIPFPNKKDIQVRLKKEYNSQNKTSKNLLSGDQWYCYQAFRALNQAVGRCIRHRYDYGAIILMDERFRRPNNLEYMSKWLRKSIQQINSSEELLEGLQRFFCRFQTKDDILKHLDCDRGGSVVSTPTVQTILNHPVILERSIQPVEHQELTPVAQGCKLSVNSVSPKPLKELNGMRSSMNNDSDAATMSCNDDLLLEVCSQRRIDSCNFKQVSHSSPLSTNDFQNTTPFSSTRKGFDITCSSTVRNSYSKHSDICETLEGNASILCTSKNTINERCQLSHEMAIRISTSETDCVGSEICDLESFQRWQKQETPSHFKGSIFSEASKADLIAEELTSSKITLGLSKADTTIRNLSQDFVSCTDEKDQLVIKQADVNCCKSSSELITSDSSCKLAVHCVSECLAEAYTRECYVLCSRCEHSLGAPEHRMRVICKESTFWKCYFQDLLNLNDCYRDKLPAHQSHILVSESSSLHPLFLNYKVSGHRVLHSPEEQSKMALSGVWVAEDGCVFRPLFCPWCIDVTFCIGAQVLAVDKKNLPLLGMALLFMDLVIILTGELNTPQEDKVERHVQEDQNNCRILETVEKRNGQSSPQAKRTKGTPSRAKLKLPRH